MNRLRFSLSRGRAIPLFAAAGGLASVLRLTFLTSSRGNFDLAAILFIITSVALASAVAQNMRERTSAETVIRRVALGLLSVGIVLGGMVFDHAHPLTMFLFLCAFLLIFLGFRVGMQEQLELEQEAGAPESALAHASRSRLGLAGVILAIGLACLSYRWIVNHRLEQTAALFIGIPTLLAIFVVLTTRPRSAKGSVCKATSIALLISGIFLGEGFICIVMAAPLFFAVALVIGAVMDRARERSRKAEATMSCVLLLAFAPMSLEGVHESVSFSREEVVSVERVVPVPAAEIRAQLARRAQFDRRLPVFLRLGFPRPAYSTGEGLQPGDPRVVRFAGGEGSPGDLVLQVTVSQPGRVLFRAVSDTSHIAHWLQWKEAEVCWREAGSNQTEVRWRIRYRRLLDPAWYFRPWERYAVRLAAGYLIDTVSIPAPGG